MRNLFILASLLFSVGAVAQVYPTQRVRYNGNTADIQPMKIGNQRASVNIKNPNGKENVIMAFEEGQDGQVKMIVRDKNTGKIISSNEGVKNKYAKSRSEFNGVKQNLDLKVSDKQEVLGKIGYSNKNTEESLFANMLGNGAGMLNRTKKGYKMSLNMKNADVGTITYTSVKTKEVICIVGYDKNISRLYDNNKKLIAEGQNNNESVSKIYNKSAYEECMKVIDIFNDDDENEDEDTSLSDIASFFGF